jgi:hypothetical protein
MDKHNSNDADDSVSSSGWQMVYDRLNDQDEPSKSREVAVEKAEFVQLCNALCRNDPSVTAIHSVPRAVNDRLKKLYLQHLGQALVGNTHVSHVTIRFPLFSQDVSQEALDNKSGLALLLRFFREGPALRSVDLSYPYILPEYLRVYLSALKLNPNLVSLNVLHWHRPTAELATFIQTSMSLKELKLNIDSFGDKEVTQTLLNNNRLEKLYVFGFGDHRHVCTFVTESTSLQQLHLANFRLSREFMRFFLDCLQLNGSIVELDLDSSEVDPEAVGVLASAAVASMASRAPSLPNMQRLGLNLRCSMDVTDPILGACAAAMVTLCRHSLKELSLKAVELEHDQRALWDTLTRHANQLKLECLRLPQFESVDHDNMNQCLPLLPSLKELHFASPYCNNGNVSRQVVLDGGTEAIEFCGAVRQSGSLCTVMVDGEFPWFLQRDVALNRLTRAALQRNQELPQLLASSSSTPPTGESDEALSMESEELTAPPPSQFPGLFVASSRAPRMAHTWVLSGLFAVSADDLSTGSRRRQHPTHKEHRQVRAKHG